MQRTRDRLAAELRKQGSLCGDSTRQAKYEGFAARAATGEFDDYADTYACPITQLHNELIMAGLETFARRVADGEFDATKEESDEWVASPDGQKALGLLSPAVRKALFGKREMPQ